MSITNVVTGREPPRPAPGTVDLDGALGYTDRRVDFKPEAGTNEMNRFFDFTPRQLTFIAVLSGTALILGGYLFVRTYAWPLEDAPRLPVFVSEGSPEYRGTFVLDPNTAPADSLELLPWIGPALTDSIIKYRAIQRFDSVEDLTRVPGIGKKTLEKMRPYLKVELL